MTKQTWHEARMGNDHQGLIIEEETGRNVAVTYKKEDAPIIVKAVNSHDALVEALHSIIINSDDQSKVIKLAKDALKLTGEA